MLFASSCVGGARRREAVPERVVARLVDSGEGLPLVEQLAEAIGAVAPVGARRKTLGLDGDLLLGGLRLVGAGRALCLTSFAARVDQRLQRVDARDERSKVADCLRLDHRLTDLGAPGVGVLGRQRPGLNALLEQIDLDGEAVVTLAIEGERRLRVAVRPLPDDPFAVCRDDVDGAVVGHPAERCLGHVAPYLNDFPRGQGFEGLRFCDYWPDVVGADVGADVVVPDVGELVVPPVVCCVVVGVVTVVNGVGVGVVGVESSCVKWTINHTRPMTPSTATATRPAMANVRSRCRRADRRTL